MRWQNADEVSRGVVVRFNVKVPTNFVVGGDDGAFGLAPYFLS